MTLELQHSSVLTQMRKRKPEIWRRFCTSTSTSYPKMESCKTLVTYLGRQNLYGQTITTAEKRHKTQNMKSLATTSSSASHRSHTLPSPCLAQDRINPRHPDTFESPGRRPQEVRKI